MKHLTCVLCLMATATLAAPVVVARVQDGEAGQPLAGAVILSEGSDVMVATDSSGRCQVVVAPRPGGALVASRTGYRGCVLTGAWPVGQDEDTVVLDFTLHPDRPKPDSGGVTGTDAEVAIPESAVPAEGPAPAGGEQPGDGLVEPGRTGAAEASRSPRDAAGVGSIVGVVSDARTGLSVPDARVAVAGTDLTTATDSAGCYTIEGVPVGMHKLLVTRAGYVNAYTVVRLVKGWAVTVNLYVHDAGLKSVPGK